MSSHSHKISYSNGFQRARFIMTIRGIIRPPIHLVFPVLFLVFPFANAQNSKLLKLTHMPPQDALMNWISRYVVVK
ncbi:uncharacterized protein F4822DRAFT_165079 [Hypoxylon trugodes]|uniref:uncharacterized protein n=1 Tax=Hypoxylon trugodes TaxID=326681 RepID=UPI002196A5CC|nr:uncharacterized protein F4822DRAFT_165079 [Hypoxylon trugodes]KAI1390851.1 hypothetical protein F4822DRAFT_165079 [Hypoxylon trugodes]